MHAHAIAILGALAALGLVGCGGAPEGASDPTFDSTRSLVTTPGDDGEGSLRAAVAAAPPGGVVAFDTDGAFSVPRTISLSGQVVVDKDLTIEGHGAEVLAVSGGDAMRLLRVQGGASVTVGGLSITNGNAPLETFDLGAGPVAVRAGGGVLVDAGSRLTLRGVTVAESRAAAIGAAPSLAGGLANVGGSLVIAEDSVVARNSAAMGGGALSDAELRQRRQRPHGLLGQPPRRQHGPRERRRHPARGRAAHRGGGPARPREAAPSAAVGSTTDRTQRRSAPPWPRSRRVPSRRTSPARAAASTTAPPSPSWPARA
jgi:hypothetical protein